MKLSTIDTIMLIFTISIIILMIVAIIRYIIYLIISFFSKLYSKGNDIPNKQKPKTDVIAYKKEDEELLRNQEKEKKQELKYFNSQTTQNITNDYEDDSRIVGVVKPIGFWTSLVLGDRLSQIIQKAQNLNKQSHKGFWVSMLESQRALERERGRQR